MTDKELKQLEIETVIMLKNNISNMCQADNIHEVYLRTQAVKVQVTNLRDYIVARRFKPGHYAGKTGECFIDEIFSESEEK